MWSIWNASSDRDYYDQFYVYREYEEEEEEAVSKNLEGISCKAYTLPGINGGEITIAETLKRDAIQIVAIGTNSVAVSLRITAEQFEALCGFNSRYDGLTVNPSERDEDAGAVVVTKEAASESVPAAVSESVPF